MITLYRHASSSFLFSRFFNDKGTGDPVVVLCNDKLKEVTGKTRILKIEIDDKPFEGALEFSLFVGGIWFENKRYDITLSTFLFLERRFGFGRIYARFF